MSYDLVVFDPSAMPNDRESFRYWWKKRKNCLDPADGGESAADCAALQSWFLEIICAFPPMNGPFAAPGLPEDEALATDYGVERQCIYACFAWSKAHEAYSSVFELAGKHGLGFYNISSSKGEVWLPDGHGGLVLAHSE